MLSGQRAMGALRYVAPMARNKTHVPGRSIAHPLAVRNAMYPRTAARP